jgi:hypothetical protein
MLAITMRMRKACLAASITVLLVFAIAAPAQPPSKPFGQDLGYLGFEATRQAWPSPEVVAAGLRSHDDRERLKALLLLGFTIDQAKVYVVDQKTGKQLEEKQVDPVDVVQLSYAALGTDDTLDAILAVESTNAQMVHAAVAIPAGKGWTRIASFDCWCKYDQYGPRDVLGEFLQLYNFFEGHETNPQHFQLVMRASGGGSDIYQQNQAHFRIRNGQMRLTIAFIDNRRDCIVAPRGPCTRVERWLIPQFAERNPGAVLVERRQMFPVNAPVVPDVQEKIPELNPRSMSNITCESYRWDEASFRYRLISGVPATCKTSGR